MTEIMDQIQEIVNNQDQHRYRYEDLYRQIQESIESHNGDDEQTLLSTIVNLQDDVYGGTLLTQAAHEDSTAFAQLLINAGANPNLQNKRGESALFIAASRGNAALAYTLLGSGAMGNQKDVVQGNTPLIEAVYNGREDTALLLLEYCVNPALFSRTEENGLLAEHGVNPALENRAEESALLIAASKGQIKVVEALIGLDINVKSNTYKRTPLSEAISNGHEKIAELLVQAGAPINSHSTIFNDLMKVAPCRYEGLAELLIENIDIGDFVKGASNPNLPFIRYLGSVANLANNCGDTLPEDTERNKYQVAAITLDVSSLLNDTLDRIPNSEVASQRQNSYNPESQPDVSNHSQSFAATVVEKDAQDQDELEQEGAPVCVIS